MLEISCCFHQDVYKRQPSTQGGAFANFLLNIPGRERSRHPECSYVAYGKYAKYLTADHDASSLAYTPFAKLIELNAKMLVFGCHDTNVGMPLGHYMEEYYGLTKRNLLKGLFRVYYFDQDGCKKLFKRTDSVSYTHLEGTCTSGNKN